MTLEYFRVCYKFLIHCKLQILTEKLNSVNAQRFQSKDDGKLLKIYDVSFIRWVFNNLDILFVHNWGTPIFWSQSEITNRRKNFKNENSQSSGDFLKVIINQSGHDWSRHLRKLDEKTLRGRQLWGHPFHFKKYIHFFPENCEKWNIQGLN